MNAARVIKILKRSVNSMQATEPELNKKASASFLEKIKASLVSFLILLFLLFLTFLITFVYYKSSNNKDIIRFSDQTARFHYSIENKLKLYTNLLKTSRGFIDNTSSLKKNEFKKFSDNLNFNEDFKGIQGLGYAEVIGFEQMQAANQKLAEENGNQLKIFPVRNDDFHSVVFYLEPQRETTKSLIGYDMASDADRREAMLKACDSGEAAITRKISPIQLKPEDNDFEFVIYLPIYKTGGVPASAEERRKNIRGFVYCPFRANQFLAEIYRDQIQKDLSVKIYSSELKPENLLTNSAADKNENKNPFTLETQAFDDELAIGGDKWILSFATLPSFENQSSVGWTPLILICGLTFSFLIFGMSYWEARALEKVKLTAAELVESEKQRTVLLEKETNARKIAEDANSSKDEFISIVSHELKTPLNAIGGWTKILQFQSSNENSRQMAINKISKNLRLQTAMIEQLLNYSDLTSNEAKLRMEEVDFVRLFEESCSEIMPLIEEKNIVFETANKLSVGIIKGDEEKLKMMIYNLFSNALKFTPDNGNIKAEISKDENFIILVVKDNGRGIDRDFLPYVFDRYKQAEKPNIRDYGGLGLGMTMTGKIVQLHQGEISVESGGKNQGASFTVKIPCFDCQTV